VVKCLLCKLEALSSNPIPTTTKKDAKINIYTTDMNKSHTHKYKHNTYKVLCGHTTNICGNSK
jgi:hypothetical protein